MEAAASLVAARGCRTLSGWLLAADYNSWRCLTTVSSVCDCFDEWHLRQWHLGTTWFAANYDGWPSKNKLPWYGTSSGYGVNDFFGLLTRWLLVFLNINYRNITKISVLVMAPRKCWTYLSTITKVQEYFKSWTILQAHKYTGVAFYPVNIPGCHLWVAGHGKQAKGTRDISSSLASIKHIKLFIQINCQ